MSLRLRKRDKLINTMALVNATDLENPVAFVND